MTFEEWWDEFWKLVPSESPAAFTLAFKEVAQKAWEAALKSSECSKQETRG